MRFTAQLTRCCKAEFVTVKWSYNLCLKIIQAQTCYPLIQNMQISSVQSCGSFEFVKSFASQMQL